MIDRSRTMALGLLGLIVLGATATAEDRPACRSPREELATLRLADPGLTIELVAAEPEVVSPVAIAWDEDGRLFVAEMIDYPSGPTAGRIRRLEDRDGDGRYEHATVFADGLPFPNGVLPCFGGVLVTAAPNIWFFRDRDGDGRADERRVVLTGFGEGNPQLRVNGLTWGLDNWIYAANGRSDGEVRAPVIRPARRSHPPPRLPVPAGRRATVEAIAGFSQFGLPHDDWGNRFPSWNTIPIRHVVLEASTLTATPTWRRPRRSRRSSTWPTAVASSRSARRRRGSTASRVAFFNASCGPTIYRGAARPAHRRRRRRARTGRPCSVPWEETRTCYCFGQAFPRALMRRNRRP